MPIFRQIQEALAASLEHFFDVPWQAIVALVVVIGGALWYAYARTQPVHHFVATSLTRTLAVSVALVALMVARRYLQ